MAAADFDGDGFADLAIGVPGNRSSAKISAGAVKVIYGSSTGLSAARQQFWTQDNAGIGNNYTWWFDGFGFSLAAGDFDRDGYSDLAIGAPGEDLRTVEDAGAVNVIYGSSTGLMATGRQFWTVVSPGIGGSPHEFAYFGRSLASGDFDGDGFDDLAIGVPNDNSRRGDIQWAAGAVNVIYGSSTGLTATGSQVWTQSSGGIGGSPEEGDYFGTSLASGDFDGDGFADLAVGVPGEDFRAIANAGAVNVIDGFVHRPHGRPATALGAEQSRDGSSAE